jgi:hypothetical protein
MTNGNELVGCIGLIGLLVISENPNVKWLMMSNEKRTPARFHENEHHSRARARNTRTRNTNSEERGLGKGALSELRFCGVAVLQCCGRLASGPSFLNRSLPGFPGANIKELWLTILSEAKRS